MQEITNGFYTFENAAEALAVFSSGNPDETKVYVVFRFAGTGETYPYIGEAENQPAVFRIIETPNGGACFLGMIDRFSPASTTGMLYPLTMPDRYRSLGIELGDAAGQSFDPRQPENQILQMRYPSIDELTLAINAVSMGTATFPDYASTHVVAMHRQIRSGPIAKFSGKKSFSRIVALTP